MGSQASMGGSKAGPALPGMEVSNHNFLVKVLLLQFEIAALNSAVLTTI